MQDLIGNGFRGTEGRILMQQEGGEGHALHGGGSTRSAGEDVSTLTLGGNMFLYQNGEMWNSTMSVQYALAPNGPNDGGFCCIAGERDHARSHTYDNTCQPAHFDQTNQLAVRVWYRIALMHRLTQIELRMPERAARLCYRHARTCAASTGAWRHAAVYRGANVSCTAA